MGDKNQPKVLGALRRLHLGPGDHPSGSDQDVHAGDRIGVMALDESDIVARVTDALSNFATEETPYTTTGKSWITPDGRIFAVDRDHSIEARISLAEARYEGYSKLREEGAKNSAGFKDRPFGVKFLELGFLRFEAFRSEGDINLSFDKSKGLTKDQKGAVADVMASMELKVGVTAVYVDMWAGGQLANEDTLAFEAFEVEDFKDQFKIRTIERHFGPGPHPGTGTDQDVHGDGNGYEFASSKEFEDGKLPLIGTKASIPTSALLTHWRGRGSELDVVNVEVTWFEEGEEFVTVEILSGPVAGEEDDVTVDDWVRWATDFDEDLVPSGDPEERAIEIFGLTDDYREAGYIMASGDLLDFSGKNQGGPGGMRSLDHRDIWQAFPEDYEWTEVDREEVAAGMIEFMRLGNIRMSYFGDYGDQSVSFDIAKLPTSAQKRAMREMVEGAEYLSWDISEVDGSVIESKGVDYPDERDLGEMFEAAVRKLVGRSLEFQYFTLRFKMSEPSHRIDARDLNYGWANSFKDEGVHTTPIEPKDGIIALPKASRGISLEEPVSPDDEKEPESENEVEEKEGLIEDIKKSFTELMAAIRRER